MNVSCGPKSTTFLAPPSCEGRGDLPVLACAPFNALGSPLTKLSESFCPGASEMTVLQSPCISVSVASAPVTMSGTTAEVVAATASPASDARLPLAAASAAPSGLLLPAAAAAAAAAAAQEKDEDEDEDKDEDEDDDNGRVAQVKEKAELRFLPIWSRMTL